MTIIDNEGDLYKIRESGKIIKEIFLKIKEDIKEGVSTDFLSRKVEEIIIAHKGKPAFKGYKGYPAAICASINNEVVHGIPSKKVFLKEGDIIGIDVGVEKYGFFTDATRTFSVGEKIDEKLKKLMEVAKNSLQQGIKKAIEGNSIGDISNAIQESIKKTGFKEVRMFVGHGIGKNLHESPEIPNWGEKGTGMKLKKGTVLAIEPMVNEGKREVKILQDGWTAVTIDGKMSAHFEDTVIVGIEKAEVIT